jgi:hypothetical protein
VDDDDTASDESESNDKYELDDNNDNDDNDDDDNYDDDDDKLDDKHESSQEDLVRWKTNLFEEAASAFRRRQKADINMQKLVYGKGKHSPSLSHSFSESKLCIFQIIVTVIMREKQIVKWVDCLLVGSQQKTV